jgi:hypothetical protein
MTDGDTAITLTQLQQSAWAQESRSKGSKANLSPIHNNVYYDSDSSSNEFNDVYAIEFVWTSNTKSYSCGSLKSVHKNRQEEMKFIFM